MFSTTSGFVKKFLQTINNKKTKHHKIVILARSKLNSIESKISKALSNLGVRTPLSKVPILGDILF